MVDHTKFLKLLAKEINRGPDKFSLKSLKTYLLEAVNVLPEGNLKDVLQQQSQENADYLWKLVKPAKKDNSQIQFKIFKKDGLETVLEKISKLQSSKEQMFHLSQAALCFPCGKVFESMLIAQKLENPDQSQLEVLSKVTELYGRLIAGCRNSEVLLGLMQVFLKEISLINDTIKSDGVSASAWLDFKDVIHNFLVYCHMKTKLQTSEDDVFDSTETKEFKDILAAIIAIYIDVVIAIGEVSEDVNNHISNMVYLLLGDSPSHILDVTHQIFTLDSSTIRIVFLFLRRVFDTTRRSTTECANYLKYVCLVWKVQRCVHNVETQAMHLKKVASSLFPPENFISWLANVEGELVTELKLSGLVGPETTHQILRCKDEETVERLLDLASSPERWGLTSKNSGAANDEDKRRNEDESNVPLFVVDAQGSSDLLEQCEEQETTSSTHDSILKMQMNSLAEKLEEHSSGDESCDINFDDSTFDLSDAENSDEEVRQDVCEEVKGTGTSSVPEENELSLTQNGKRKRKSQKSFSDEKIEVESVKKRVSRKRRSLRTT